MPTYYSDDYERITGDAVPADNHPRLTPEPLKNITGAETDATEAVTVTKKVIEPPAAETK